VTSKVRVRRSAVATTLELLQEAGRGSKECVVLWLGERTVKGAIVVDVYRPNHDAAEDFFYIPRQSIEHLFDRLRSSNLLVLAQVHSHPAEAFHSRADDQWAIIRHVGAVSPVLPNFAMDTTPNTFFDRTAAFRLAAGNQWQQVPVADACEYLDGGP